MSIVILHPKSASHPLAHRPLARARVGRRRRPEERRQRRGLELRRAGLGGLEHGLTELLGLVKIDGF